MTGRAKLANLATAVVVLTLITAATIVFSPFASAQGTITQGSPQSGTIDAAGSANFTDTLTAASGFTGLVTFADPTLGFTITDNDVLNTPGPLSSADSPYDVSGTDSDGSGDTGTWVYVLTVTNNIVQGSPTFGSTTANESANFTDTLSAAPGYGQVTFANPTLGFTITDGDVLNTPGPLSVQGSPYEVSGTDSDGSGDTGTWNYSLTVTAGQIVQGSPTLGSTPANESANFTDTLTAASGAVGPVTFANPTLGFTITDGDVLNTPGPLSVQGSPYEVSGTDSDGSGDTGTWNYSLTVTAGQIVQGAPNSGSTQANASATFASTLTAASGAVGPVTFTTSTSGFTITNGNELKSTGPLSVADSPYTITGHDSDIYGDAGSWTYSLTVLPTGGTAKLIQTSPTTGTVSDISSGTFTSGPITVENNTGPVTFVTTKTSPGLTVSASGLISSTGSLTIGTYGVSGTDSDASGDSGTWTYTLTVTGVVVAVTFDANGGVGVMAPESESQPTALSLNTFKRTGYTFVDWNTAANGSGQSYSNGSIFPFSAPTTLFAQWKAGKAPSHTVTFAANGGTGSMAAETDNTPTAISASKFYRAGFTFRDWNTTASGSGRKFDAGATYSFKTSITLYAQWKKIPAPATYGVAFVANGGAGFMSPERHHGPAALSLNTFKRTGYAFLDWNTAANGSGQSYSNGATYSFASSTNLYAQWKKNKATAPPRPKNVGPTVGPFASEVSTLSGALESQIRSLASTVKTKKASQIALVGYGDLLTKAEQGNQTAVDEEVALGRLRAQAVATYLEGQLSDLGVKGWTISIAGANSKQLTSSQYDAATVVATLS
jgi:outer membrane protein OmpA-like peptidoglycan-associated protein